MIPFLAEKKGILISFGLALFVTILIVNWMSQQQKKYGEFAQKQFEHLQTNAVETVFAKIDIPQGKVITEDMLYVKFLQKDSVPPEAAPSVVRVVERIAAQPIKKDSIIISNMVVWPTATETTLAMKTPIGKRAITISADNISSLVGMIKPGDYVDVVGLIPLPVQIEGKVSQQLATVSLFQNVQVLAVGSHIGRTDKAGAGSRRKTDEEAPAAKESSPLITLALGPEEANLLAFVQEQGKIRLVLRSPGDARIEALPPAGYEALLKYLYPGMDFSPKKEELKKEIPQVEVIRGLKKEMIPLTQRNER